MYSVYMSLQLSVCLVRIYFVLFICSIFLLLLFFISLNYSLFCRSCRMCPIISSEKTHIMSMLELNRDQFYTAEYRGLYCALADG